MAFRFVYLFDPLCGWCYGATAGIAALTRDPDVIVEPLATGLFADAGARTLTAGVAQQILAADARIGALTGAVFGRGYRESVAKGDDVRLDSGPATLALAAVAQSAPDRVVEALGILQRARYVTGRDIADPVTLAALLDEAGLSAAAAAIVDPTTSLIAADRAGRDRAQALMRRHGLTGVPSLLRDEKGILTPLDGSALYSDPMSLVPIEGASS